MKRAVQHKSGRVPELIGWRELVGLPDLGIDQLPAKIDTGARTSALHAEEIESYYDDNARWVSFYPAKTTRATGNCVIAKVLDERRIKNTSGVAETRIIIGTTLLLGRHCWHIQLSLASRENMEFELILGRTALRRRGVAVDPGRSYLAGMPNQTARHTHHYSAVQLNP